MINVITVLRSGGEFTPAHVAALRDQVAAHLARGNYEFFCLTDLGEQAELAGVSRITAQERWPGWWAKIELFSLPADNPLLYLDLDTRIVGALHDIAFVARRARFTMLSDFYRPAEAASGLMCWRGGELRAIYARFREDPKRWMAEFAEGDQGFIKDCIAKGYVAAPDRWQDQLPGQVISYKCHVQGRDALPENARVVCFHGRPRPWEVALPDARQDGELREKRLLAASPLSQPEVG